MINGKRICPVMSRPAVAEFCPEPDDKKFAEGEGFVLIGDIAYDEIFFCPHSDDCEFWVEVRLQSGATKYGCAYAQQR